MSDHGGHAKSHSHEKSGGHHEKKGGPSRREFLTLGIPAILAAVWTGSNLEKAINKIVGVATGAMIGMVKEVGNLAAKASMWGGAKDVGDSGGGGHSGGGDHGHGH